MDWYKIWMLLEVVHKSVNVPNTEVIRRKALEELKAWNSDAPMEEDSEPAPELKLEGRRL